MKGRLRILHKIYGGLRIIQVCQDWPKWFNEYFRGVNDGRINCYRMRCGVDLYTRRNGSDFHMIDEVWAFRKYDFFGYRVNTGEIVVDIGANIGTFTIYAARVCGASRVISFEPFPDNYKILTKNVEQNSLNMVTCLNQAVAGNRGPRSLILSPTDSGAHSLVTGSSCNSVQVECCTLEDIFQQFSLKKIDYLKMDCEGAEYEILENATQRIRQISRISMETHTISDRKAEDLEKLLRSQHFDVRIYNGHRLYATRLS